jgi:hypothetical protein
VTPPRRAGRRLRRPVAPTVVAGRDKGLLGCRTEANYSFALILLKMCDTP